MNCGLVEEKVGEQGIGGVTLQGKIRTKKRSSYLGKCKLDISNMCSHGPVTFKIAL